MNTPVEAAPIVLPKETPKSQKAAKVRIVKVQNKNKTADPDTPKPADEVLTTASKRGGGPDGKPGKKARKTKEEKARTPITTKPAEQVMVHEEEQPMKAGKKAKKTDDEDAEKSNDQILPEYKLSGKSIFIKPPGQAKIPEQIASVKEAIKGKELSAKQLEHFKKLVNLEDPYDYEQKDFMEHFIRM